MKLINVNNDKCIKCGLCSKVCPMNSIVMGDDGPQAISKVCVKCGHCVAVCPLEALNNVNLSLDNQIPLKNTQTLDADTAAKFLKSRRSIRSYKQMAVPREKILQLLDVARFAQTSANSQGVAYHVVDDTNTLRSITNVIISWAEEEIKKGSKFSSFLTTMMDLYHKTCEDPILRNAPCLVLTTMNKDMPSSFRENGRFSLVYAELYAPSLGLGSCWCGISEACFLSGYGPLLSLLNLPENIDVTGAILLGYPQYKLRRLVERDSLKITWQNSIDR